MHWPQAADAILSYSLQHKTLPAQSILEAALNKTSSVHLLLNSWPACHGNPHADCMRCMSGQHNTQSEQLLACRTSTL